VRVGSDLTRADMPSDIPLTDGLAPDDASGLTDDELRALLARAKAAGDEPLRRLVASFVTLRRLTAEALTLVETQYGAAAVARVPALSHLKRLVRRER
jgi:hypothetical protein